MQFPDRVLLIALDLGELPPSPNYSTHFLASQDNDQSLVLNVIIETASLSMTSNSLETQLQEGLLTKHPEFWFSDGSLILRAHSVLFRVHISQLSRKSAFFRDLFSMPQPFPTDCREQYLDGCLVLDVHDSPEDIGNLVKVIYDGPYVLTLLPRPTHQHWLLFLRHILAATFHGDSMKCDSWATA